MAASPELHEPQIAAARAQAWHQTGEALLTLEAARGWIDKLGLILFAPRATSLGAPAPSLVEATLGSARETTTLAEAATARSLAARLVSEGSVLPLNLLGGPGDVPDFLVPVQAFPFVFALRGDKGWKRPPETSGAVKVTPLGLRVFEILKDNGALTVAELVDEVGREITESAVARALSELWQMVRVIPVLDSGDGPTRWELLTVRFLKAVKAGANAGQPTALSGLVASYLSQVYVATETEIAAFLSPLTARSRVREVLHGLGAAQQLSEGVIAGKTVLFIPESLPDFAAFAEPQVASGEELDELVASAEPEAERDADKPSAPGAPEERIRRFGSKAEGGPDRNLRGKPVRREGGFSRGRPGPGSGDGFARGPKRREANGGGFERRNEGGRGAAPGRPARFDRPWDEERTDRRPRSEGENEKRPFVPRERPSRPREEGEGFKPRRSFPPRGEDRGAAPRPRRPGFGAQGAPDGRGQRSGDREPRNFGARPDRPKRPWVDRGEGGPAFRSKEGRPPRSGPPSGDRPFRPRRPAGEGEGEGARPRQEFRSDRPDRGERRPFDGAGPRNFRGGEGRSEGEQRPDKGFKARPFGANKPRSGRPEREGNDSRPRRDFSAGRSRPSPGGGFRGPREEGSEPVRRAPRQDAGGFRPDRKPFGGGRPGGSRPGGARPGGARSGGAKPGGARPGGPGKSWKSAPRGDFGARRPGATGKKFAPRANPSRPPRRSPEDEG